MWPMFSHETSHLNVYLSKGSSIFSLQNSNLCVSSLWLILKHKVALPLLLFPFTVEMLLLRQDLQIFSYLGNTKQEAVYLFALGVQTS